MSVTVEVVSSILAEVKKSSGSLGKDGVNKVFEAVAAHFQAEDRAGRMEWHRLNEIRLIHGWSEVALYQIKPPPQFVGCKPDEKGFFGKFDWIGSAEDEYQEKGIAWALLKPLYQKQEVAKPCRWAVLNVRVTISGETERRKVISVEIAPLDFPFLLASLLGKDCPCILDELGYLLIEEVDKAEGRARSLGMTAAAVDDTADILRAAGALSDRAE